nr:NADH dehydrogenase subunit 6 [Habroloma sp.]
MLVILTISLMISSTSFLLMKHPLSMGFNLLIQTIMIALMSGLMNYNFWYSYILFLVMVGGMLVLFIYMTSISSNEKFSFKKSWMIMWITFIIMIVFLSKYSQELSNELISWNQMNMNWKNSLNKYFMFPQNMMLIMLMIYLFITLIAVVKITKIEYGPLRNTY